MKKILGLDLGVSSIGWAIVGEENGTKTIFGMGSRIIPLSTDDKNEFSSGNAISKNQKRTQKRTQRKGYDRYQLRRKYLVEILSESSMMPEKELFELDAANLYGLRARAVSQQISLCELGRIFMHLNQKRGYKSARSEANLDKKDTEYVAEVKNRHEILRSQGLTVGEFFYTRLLENPRYRIKGEVYPREAYIEEFDRICVRQVEYYPEVLNKSLLNRIRNEIIYYQRPLKSQKGLVSRCEFERFRVKTADGKEHEAGPKVAPRSSPLFQAEKIWETINNITIKDKKGEPYHITLDQKRKIFAYLDGHERMSFADFLKVLGLKKDAGWNGNKMLLKGLQGNTTKARIIGCLEEVENPEELTRFELVVRAGSLGPESIDPETGEIIETKVIDPSFESEPLYRLWHKIYSIPEKDHLVMDLKSCYGFSDRTAEKLAAIDFTRSRFGNKSARAIRKILPYLMEGHVYSKACSFAGYNHSDSLTRDENLKRILLERITAIPRNSLRQPVVEKILNQLVNLVNAVIDRYGKPDEVRIELARELKQSKEERNETYKNINARERENDEIAKRIEGEYGLKATRRNIIKWRLFNEIHDTESKLNAVCIYCGQLFGITQALKGIEVDIEHIVPQSRLFDDSISNKTLSHKKCNLEKGQRTAFDYMRTRSSDEFDHYLERVARIGSRAKRDRLLMPGDKIPDNFIDRQLRQTQYITKKSREILQQVCHHVFLTSGSVTDFLRRIWGWHEVTINLQLKKLHEAGLDELITFAETEDAIGNLRRYETISGWSKRDDHRHHAIDALVIACTRQGYIQRINTLNAEYTCERMDREEDGQYYHDQKMSLERYFYQERPFTTAELEEKVAGILVSYKGGKKVATFEKRRIRRDGRNVTVQEKILVPRGALSEEHVYGKIRTLQKMVPLKDLFTDTSVIVKEHIRLKITERLSLHGGDVKKAIHSCRKDPIYIDKSATVPLSYASIYRDEYVIKYPVGEITVKDLPSVVDGKIRKAIEQRLLRFNNNAREAFKDLANDPIYADDEGKIPVRTVRCFTGLTAVTPVKRDEKGKPVGFVKPGNNHHVAIYLDENDEYREHVVTFWHAVERMKAGVPVIIRSPADIWDRVEKGEVTVDDSFLESLPLPRWRYILNLQQNEMFVLGFEKNTDLPQDYKIISGSLYRVQKIAHLDYVFRIHNETKIDDSPVAMKLKKFARISSLNSLVSLNPKKVRINILGIISESEQ
jgi:CRISPR-associated endonuclease Csn1